MLTYSFFSRVDKMEINAIGGIWGGLYYFFLYTNLQHSRWTAEDHNCRGINETVKVRADRYMKVRKQALNAEAVYSVVIFKND